MAVKIVIVVGVSVAMVVLMFVFGKMADGKSDDTGKKNAAQES